MLMWLPPNTKSSFVEIIDPVAGYRYLLDTDSRTARRAAWPIPKRERHEKESIDKPVDPSAANPIPRAHPQKPPVHPQVVAYAPPDNTVTSLGMQYIEGVMAQGTRKEITYHLLKNGQTDSPTVCLESWVSPELKIIVFQKTSDSRSGDGTIRLTGLLQAEPDPWLFQVPQDYKIVDGAPDH